MKKIYMMLLTLVTAAITLTGCSCDEDPFITASENDFPRILNTDIPEWSNGAPGLLSKIARDANFTFTVLVTPTQYTTVSWVFDGEKLAEGTTIDIPLLAGEYDLQIVATTTKGLETSRRCKVIVVPLDGDPVLVEDPLERLLAPSATAEIHGENNSNITKVIINGKEATDVKVVGEGSDAKLVFTCPALEDGTYRLVMSDGKNQYGGGLVTVSSAPFVNTESVRTKPNAEVTLIGINLDKVGSIKVGETEAKIVSQAFGNLVFTCPALESGDYTLTATDNNGKAVSFKGNESITLTITAETTLWEGSFSVTWGTPFNALQSTMKNLVSAGTIVRIYVTGTGGQGAATTAWWNNILTGKGDPERGDIMINGSTTLEYELTDLSMQLMQEQDGFLIVGNGYDVLRVTAE